MNKGLILIAKHLENSEIEIQDRVDNLEEILRPKSAEELRVELDSQSKADL